MTDERVDRLYDVPLAEFTAERNALAKDFRKKGDRESAEAVKGLRKPSVEAWTVNQLARQHRGEVERLVELGEEQPGILASGDRDLLRKAMGDLRGTLTSLANHAERILGGSDRKATPALLERVTRMVQNAAGTEEGRAALRAGRFTAEPGEEDLPDVELAIPSPSRKEPAAEKGARAQQQKQRAEEKNQLAEREVERARLERDLRRAEERARLLKEKAEDLEQRAAEAREAAVAAEEAAGAARESVVAHGGC